MYGPHSILVSVVGMGPGLVEATLADVADPLHHVMVTVVQLGLKHLEEWWAGFGREHPIIIQCHII